MAFHDPKKNNGIQRETRAMQEKIRSWGGSIIPCSEIPPNLYHRLLQNIITLESEKIITLQKVFPKRFTFPPLEQMTKRQFQYKYRRLLQVLKENNISLELQPDLPKSLIYEFLRNNLHDIRIKQTLEKKTIIAGCDWNCPICFQQNYCQKLNKKLSPN